MFLEQDFDFRRTTIGGEFYMGVQSVGVKQDTPKNIYKRLRKIRENLMYTP